MSVASHDPRAADAPPLGDLAGEAGASLGWAIEADGAGRLSADEMRTLKEARALLSRLQGEAGAAAREGAGPADSLCFDISDLLGYWPYNRLPTGVQRVQVNTILAILDAPEGWDIGLCCFSEKRRVWLSVPVSVFRDVCEMSVAGGDATAPGWRAQVARLHAVIEAGAPFVFPHGARLVNLGTSWWVENYFMCLREAKRASAIRFIPFVHDMIPILFPEHCIPDLVYDFIDWLAGIVQHADAFLANSDATKRDLIALAAKLGRTIAPDEVVVVPLAANPVPPPRPQAKAMLAGYGLHPDGYVLFVSTIEQRKNQDGAFDAWRRLIAHHGRDKTPKLVCVGKRGFRSDVIIGRLHSFPELADRVTVLEGIDDEVLDALYDNALFTLYPSFYEGWGLPVTESLGHGKVPLVADNSSLPQAGGGFAMTFATGSLDAMVKGLETLIFDPAERRRREAAIASGYRPRGWTDVSGDIALLLRPVAQATGGEATVLARPGYYPVMRNQSLRLDHPLASGEPFRCGNGWWRLEEAGCWTRPGGGHLRLKLDAAASVAVCLVGLPEKAVRFSIVVVGGEVVSGVIDPLATRWLFLDLPAGESEIAIGGADTEAVLDEKTELMREIGVGLRGLFILDPANPHARQDFVEAIALGALRDHQRPAGALRR